MRNTKLFLALVVMIALPGTKVGATGVEEAGSGFLTSGFPTELRKSIARSPYTIVEDATDPGSYWANNPEQGLRASFRAKGFQVLVGKAEAEWGMQLSGYGRTDAMVLAAGADIVVDQDRIEYRRDGVTEWYVNSRRGIEQGFTVHQPPGGSGELVIDLIVTGGLEAERVGSDLAFLGERARIGYRKLHAFDAMGRPLASRMELVALGDSASADGGTLLRLSVNDQDARYPIVVDPIIGTEKKVVPFDPEFGGQFGYSVSIDGDTAIAGSRLDDPGGTGFLDIGSAYIYQRDVGGTNNWGLVQKITASDAAANDQFGVSVSISVDTVIVGAYGSGSSAGAAYVYERDVGGVDNWGEVTKLTASDGVPIDLFGVSVSIDGDRALVGARRNSDAGADSGSAYIFQRDFGGVDNWGEVTKIVASDADANDNFGFSVSLSGDTALIGAYSEGGSIGVSGTGSAYVYQQDLGGIDNWGEVTKLNASDAASNDGYGWSVSLSGDYAIVGAQHDDDAGMSSGSAYLYQRDSGGVDNWGEFTKLTASDATTVEHFGQAVAIGGDTVLVGGHGDSDAGAFSGSAYLFREDEGGIGNWGEVIKLTASDATSQADFGFSVAVSGDELMVGTYNDESLVFAAGSAYIYMDTSSIEVPALNADAKVVLVLLIAASVLAGIYRVDRRRSRVLGNGDHT